MVLFPSKLTARVVYKLLWNLLKTHRFILGPEVRSVFLYCMSDAQDAQLNAMQAPIYITNKLVIHSGKETAETSGCWFSYDVATTMIQQSGSIAGRAIQHKLMIATVLDSCNTFRPKLPISGWLIL
ncbi:hypothetical protein ACA910_007498 [Epithemia clementina (nom. ined.)]